MMRPPFAGHRRYSITHRAVQRLRELCPGRDEEDDETLRDRLDAALAAAEDSGRAIRTLDAMLGEPQTLIPVDAFGDTMYAIIKEDTVVTVLPQGHGEEILQRGQAMEQRVAAGHVQVRGHGGAAPGAAGAGPGPGSAPGSGSGSEEDRWDRRRWRKDNAPVVIERVVRNGPPGRPEPAPAALRPDASTRPAVGVRPSASATVVAPVVAMPERPVADGPVIRALAHALEEGRRRAAVAALTETLRGTDPAADLLPLWNEVAAEGLPPSLKIGDLLAAVHAAGRKP